jgi:very-short-patch-repair endonuclease
MNSEPPRLRPLVAKLGYLHLADAREAGWRPDAIRSAVRAEGLVRAGRAWILLPTASTDLLTAAKTGCTVACVSAAALRKVWRPGHDTITHLAVPRGARRTPPDVRAHWRASVVAQPRRHLVDAIENILAVVATCQQYEDALSVWDSAVRKGLITVERLQSVSWHGERARALRDQATALSHSGTETLFVTRMRRIGVAVRQQAKIAGHHVDGLIGARLVIQIDGFEHHADVRQRRSDIAHDRALRLLGYTVLRFDYHEIVDDWRHVETVVVTAIAQNLHLSS